MWKPKAISQYGERTIDGIDVPCSTVATKSGASDGRLLDV